MAVPQPPSPRMANVVVMAVDLSAAATFSGYRSRLDGEEPAADSERDAEQPTGRAAARKKGRRSARLSFDLDGGSRAVGSDGDRRTTSLMGTEGNGMGAHLRIFSEPRNQRETEAQAPGVTISLRDLLPLLTLAHRNNFLW